MSNDEAILKKHERFSAMLTTKPKKEVSNTLKSLQRESRRRSWERREMSWLKERMKRAKAELEYREIKEGGKP